MSEYYNLFQVEDTQAWKRACRCERNSNGNAGDYSKNKKSKGRKETNWGEKEAQSAEKEGKALLVIALDEARAKGEPLSYIQVQEKVLSPPAQLSLLLSIFLSINLLNISLRP